MAEQQINISAQINRALGVFLFFFGIVVVIATFFTATFAGKMTNLVSGLLFVIIGGLMIWRNRRQMSA